MICIYQKGNTDYTKNGDAVLNPTSAMLTMTINGAWQLTIEHPYDAEGKFEYLVEDAVVRADVLCINELETVQQRFRIYNYVRNLHSVTAIAFPIAMESTYDAPVDNIILQNATGQQAMAALQQKTNKYTLSTDITAVASTSWANTNVNSAIAGSSDNTFLKVWGGEILYDNLKYKVRSRLGSNVAADHKVTYGNNLESIEYKKDDSGLITRIYPISKDGIRLNGTGYVDSPHISDYAVPHARYMEAPYSLISTSADDPSSTAQLTRQAISAVNSAASSLSQSVYATAKGNGYQPEYIKTIRSEIVSAVQTMTLQNVISTSLYNAMASTIASAMDWMKDLKQPKWGWMGSDQSGWKYGDATSYAKNMYVKIGKTWSYFGNDGNWQEPKDSSDEWDWHDAKNGNGKQYGNFKKYYAHNEYVYITQSGTIKEYWFNEQGWFEEDESGDSDYYWHGSGTGADPYWFGASSSDYLKSCWRFIDGTYYFFDSYGYVAAQKDNYRWDWVENGDSSRAWFGNAEDSEYAADYLTSQWEKINGTWYYFDASGIVESESVSQTKAVALFTTGMASLTSTVDNWKGQLYTLLYNLMRSYCAYQYRQGVDIPSITISVNMVELSQTTEYEGYEHLETIKLGDSVQCDDYQHSISTINRVVGITYDCIYKKIATVVLGEASATVQQMVGNANGQAVAGGFDTSALETQLTALRNSKQDKLTAGENIEIINNVISATGGGGSKIYNGTGIPSASLGSNGDAYFRVKLREEDILSLDNFDCLSSEEYPFELTEFTRNSRSSFSFKMGGVDGSAVSQAGYGETAWFTLDGLVDGNTYTIDFDFQFVGTSFLWQHEGNALLIRHSDQTTEKLVYFATDNSVHSYSASFEYTEGDELLFTFYDVTDYRRWDSIFTNLNFTGEFIEKRIWQIYGKINDEWLLYYDDESGTQVIANPEGEPTDVLSKVSIEDVIYEIEKTDVEANPSDPATDTLNTIGIDGTVYNIAGGGGGGNSLILDAQIYSLDEQVVGVWTDNKPLYQKTVVLNSISTGERLYTLDFVNVDTIVAREVSCIREPQGSTKDYIIDESILELWGEGSVIPQIWRVNADNVQVSLYSGYYTPTNISITLQYTKTTDTAGSGGYQAYGFSPVIYSSAEREIGVWHDGKPLYRKMFDFTSSPISLGSSWANTSISSTDIDKIVTVRAFHSDGTVYEEINADPTRSNHTWVGVRGSGTAYYLMLEYTKLSDSAGSGSYNTLGVPTIHYTTDEQVIGTWIDGKPIYRKIFTNLNITPSYNAWTVVGDIPANSEKYIGTDLIICEGANGNIDLSHSGLEITFSNSEGKIKIEYNQNANIRPINILSILYTKTTD